MKPRILITGAAGFVGSNLVHRLYGQQYFLGVDDLSFGFKDNVPEGTCSFVDFKDIGQEVLQRYDILVHLATSNIIYAMEHPVETMQNNAVKTLELFKRFKGKIIYTSTASVYGNADNFPTHEDSKVQLSNAYDTSKYIAEQFLRQRGNYTTLRLSNVYGPFQDAKNPYCGVMGKFLNNAMKGSPLQIYGNGNATRDYTYVDDVIDAIILAIEQEAMATEINIATGVETSVDGLAKLVSREFTQKFNNIERMEERKIDGIRRRCLDNSRAANLLSWHPKTTLQEGIRQTIKYLLHLSKASR